MDDAELLGVALPGFRIYVRFSLQIFCPLALGALLIYNAVTANQPVIRTALHSSESADIMEALVGWIFSLTPPILILLSVLKQLTTVPKVRHGKILAKWR